LLAFFACLADFFARFAAVFCARLLAVFRVVVPALFFAAFFARLAAVF
jgi:hypothetical protein